MLLSIPRTYLFIYFLIYFFTKSKVTDKQNDYIVLKYATITIEREGCIFK